MSRRAPVWLVAVVPDGRVPVDPARSKRGLARAAVLSPERRTAIARMGGFARAALPAAELAAFGRKGGRATASRMSPEARSALGRKGAEATNRKRWGSP